MDKLNVYRGILQKLICQSPYYKHGSTGPEEETVFLRDETDGNYMLFDVGWREKERIFNVILFVRIKDGKIWIEEDWTEEGIAEDLLREGVPREDIVLGFQPPKMRPYTDFAVA